MAGTSLFFDILARDHASATFNKVANAAGTLGKRTDQASKSHAAFGKMVRWTGGMLSAYGVATYLKSSVQEYAKAEAAQNKLANSYRRFPKMQNATLQSFKDLNSQLQMHTRFDDDDTAAMQANLARFDLTGKQVQKLTPLVADLAQVQGTDMVTAGGNLGKAMLGNTRALKALGISYTATGNKAKDYRNVVDLINKKVGGESAKASQTAATKLAILDNQWGELKETVGQAVMPAVVKLADAAGPAIDNFGDAVERNLPQIQQTFDDVWGAAKRFGGALKGIWDGFSSMPDGVRKVLLAMAGGTWALGKVKGSALGTGLSSVFSGIKTITAGNVTVIGKSVDGGGLPGKGGKTGSPISKSAWLAGEGVGIASMLSSAAVVSAITVAAGAAYYKLMDPMPKIRQQGGNPTTLAGSYGSNRTINTSKPQIRQDWVDKQAEVSAARYAAQWRNVTMSIKDATGAYVSFAFEAKNKRWIDEKQPRAIDAAADRYKALAKAVRDVPSKKDVKVSDNGTADKAHSRVKLFGIAIAGLKGRNVKVNESGADASRNRVKGLGGQIGALKGRTVAIKTDTSQAIGGIGAVASALNNLDGKTVDTYIRQHNVKGAAGGGYITGPGTATSDSIPARLSNGEFVMQAAAVDHYGVGMMHALNARRFAKGGSAKKAKDLAKELAQAKHEANRQKQIAAQVERLGLGDTAISYLGGLSSQAALKALKKPGALRKSARKAGALSGLQNRRQAARDAAAQALADQQAAAEAAAQAAADAAAAAEEAARREIDAQASVRDSIEQSAASYRSFASIATTSYDTVEEAQSKLTDATQKVTDAQAKFDYAGNDRDRAAAAKELAAALHQQSTAQQNANQAGKPTTGSIRANMAGKLSRLRDFSAAVKQLKANGLNAVTLADILQMGPDQGYDFAKALLDGGLSDINDLQNQITAESASLGLTSSGINSAATTAIGQANAAAGGLNVALVPAPVTLNLDGAVVAQALLTYQRQQGG